MEGGALSDEAFAKFAKDYVLFCHVTTHVETDQYQEDLMMAAGGEGWPHLAFHNAEGDLIGVHDGERTVEAFAETGEIVRAYRELKARVAAGDDSARPDLLMNQIQLGLLPYSEAKDQARDLEMTEEQRGRIQALLFDLEVMMIMDGIRQDPKGRERLPDIARMWMAEARKGRSPIKEEPFFLFWSILLEQADRQEDAEGFRLASKAYHARFDDKEDERYQQVMQAIDARLKELDKKDGDG